MAAYKPIKVICLPAISNLWIPARRGEPHFIPFSSSRDAALHLNYLICSAVAVFAAPLSFIEISDCICTLVRTLSVPTCVAWT